MSTLVTDPHRKCIHCGNRTAHWPIDLERDVALCPFCGRAQTKEDTVGSVSPIAGIHVETFKGEGTQPWRFRLVGGNGETVATSEGYATKWNRNRAVAKAFPGIPVVEK